MSVKHQPPKFRSVFQDCQDVFIKRCPFDDITRNPNQTGFIHGSETVSIFFIFYFRPHHQFPGFHDFSTRYTGILVEPIYRGDTVTFVYPSENPLNPPAGSGFGLLAIHLFRCGFLFLFCSSTMQFLAK